MSDSNRPVRRVSEALNPQPPIWGSAPPMTSARFPRSLQLFTVPPASFDGAFKIPLLRNVALTAPYFHNGDVRTLREVVEL